MLCFFMFSCGVALKVTSTPPLLDVPTYSLATLGQDGKTGMNILTYATPVSVKPVRMWAIGLSRGTVAHENFSKSKEGVLQLLKIPHADLVHLLGGSSGRDVDKQSGCAELGFPWMNDSEWTENECVGLPQLLPDCAYYVHLKLQGELIDAGGHDVAICTVNAMLVNETDEEEEETDTMTHLSTASLREMGIISDLGRVLEKEG